MITQRPQPSLIPAQIRAARALIGWSQQQLAEVAKLSLSSVRDYENERRGGVVGGLKAIRITLENEGIVFLAGDETNGPGVRLAGRTPSVMRRPTRLSEHDALVIPMQWRGRAVEVFIPKEVLEDLGQIPGHSQAPDAEYIDLFDQHRAAILAAAARAIDANRVTPDRRVHLDHGDFSGLTP